MKHLEAYESFLNEDRSHLKEVKPNLYVYHTSNPMFRDKISREGLIPQGKSEAWLFSMSGSGLVMRRVERIILGVMRPR